MKVILLAGGFGTRLSEYTESIPKPMVMIGDKPIIWHIMKRYSLFGHKEFILALGYKQEAFKDYFLNYKILNSDFYSADLVDSWKSREHGVKCKDRLIRCTETCSVKKRNANPIGNHETLTF